MRTAAFLRFGVSSPKFNHQSAEIQNKQIKLDWKIYNKRLLGWVIEFFIHDHTTRCHFPNCPLCDWVSKASFPLCVCGYLQCENYE